MIYIENVISGYVKWEMWDVHHFKKHNLKNYIHKDLMSVQNNHIFEQKVNSLYMVTWM